MMMLLRSTAFLAFAALITFLGGCKRLVSGFDQTPGPVTTFLLCLQPATNPETGERVAVDNAVLTKAEQVLSKRISSAGFDAFVIKPQPPDRLTVRCKALAPEQLEGFRKLIVTTAVLDFRMVHPESDSLLPAIEAKKNILDPAWMILPYKNDDEKAKDDTDSRRRLLVHRIPDITGEHIRDARAQYDQQGWHVCIDFDKVAGEKFYQLTKAMRKNVDRFAIVLDDKIISAPTTQVDGGIAGNCCFITGKYTEESARIFASQLLNPLRNPIKIEEESTK